MNETPYVAERKFLAVDAAGKEVEITARLGTPYHSLKFNSWACPVDLDGLFENLAHQHGIDSWQAIRMAQKLVLSLLKGFIEKGGKLFLFGDNQELKMEHLDEFF